MIHRVPGGLSAAVWMAFSIVLILAMQRRLPVGVVAVLVLAGALMVPRLLRSSLIVRGPAVVNATTRTASSRRNWVIGAGIVATLAMRDIEEPWIAFTLFGVAFAWGVWKSPAFAAAIALFASLANGGEAILLAAPAVVMLARRDARLRMTIPRSVVRTLTTLALAVVAFILTLPFAALRAGGAGSGPGAGQGASGVPQNGVLARFVRWALGLEPGGELTPGRPVRVPGREPEPPSDPSHWWIWLLVAAAVAAIAISAVWWWRRRSRNAHGFGATSARPLARLEALGAAVGRPRRRSEGALTYARQLSERTGDQRLPETGDLVSGRLYASSRVAPATVDETLARLESAPPRLPPRSVRERLSDWAAWPRRNGKGLALAAAGTGLLVLAAWLIVPSFDRFDDREDEPMADGFVPRPAILDDLLARPAEELSGWVTCAAQVGSGESILRRAVVTDGSASTTYSAWYGSPQGSGQLTVATATRSWHETPNGWRASDWQSTPLRAFASTAEVLEALRVEDPVISSRTDRNGDAYVRYEALPVSVDSSVDTLPETPTLGSPFYEYPTAVDVWTDGDGTPSRVRTMSASPSLEWYEWRLLDNAVLEFGDPVCPTRHPSLDPDWLGAEEWTPTVVAPLRIAFDHEGNPYDDDVWATNGDVHTRPGTTIDVAVERLAVTDYFVLYDWAQQEWASDLPEAVVPVSWPPGSEVSLLEVDDWPVAVRIDRADGAPVERWDDPAAIEVWESFVMVELAEVDESLDDQAIDAALDPLWQGAPDAVLDRDRDGTGDALVLTLSDASRVVVGRDDNGDIVSIVIDDGWIEWRRLGFEGRAPSPVLQRERELRACLTGDRPVDAGGYCT